MWCGLFWSVHHQRGTERVEALWCIIYVFPQQGGTHRSQQHVGYRIVYSSFTTVHFTTWQRTDDTMHNSPHSSTGFSPALLFFHRNIKTGLPQLATPISNELHDEVRNKDANSQQKMKENFTNRFHPQKSTIAVGDKILIKQPKKINFPVFINRSRLLSLQRKDR